MERKPSWLSCAQCVCTSPPHELRVEEVDRPTPVQGEVLVKVEAAGVLSDVHLISGELGGTPALLRGDTVTLGHEVAGIVAEPGPGRGRLGGRRPRRPPGRRVPRRAGLRPSGRATTEAGPSSRSPGSTPWSRSRTRSPSSRERSSPTRSPPVGRHHRHRRCVRPGQAVGVWGIGGLGAHGVQLLRMVGACPIIAVDPSPAARDRALAFGADLALDPADPALADKVAAATRGAGIEAAFDFAGVTPVREQALSVLADGGKLVLVGLSGKPVAIADSTTFSTRELRLLGHFGSSTNAVAQLIHLTENGRLDFSAPSRTYCPWIRRPKPSNGWSTEGRSDPPGAATLRAPFASSAPPPSSKRQPPAVEIAAGAALRHQGVEPGAQEGDLLARPVLQRVARTSEFRIMCPARPYSSFTASPRVGWAWTLRATSCTVRSAAAPASAPGAAPSRPDRSDGHRGARRTWRR